MSEFNFDAFRPVPVNVADTTAKRANVSAATQSKKDLLTAKKESWVQKAGLEEGSFLGNRVNDIASLASGASRLVGDIATLPMNLGAAAETAGATEAEYAAYNRVQQGSIDPYDLKVAKQFQNADHLRGMAKSLKETLDLSGAVDQTNRQSLSADLGDDFESNWSKVTTGWKDGKPGQVTSGLAGLLLNAGEAVITNPSAAREYILENAPQLFVGTLGAVGKAGLAASNIGYAADTYRQGLEEYAAKNGGALPPEEERTKRAIYAATLAGAEQAGDMLGLGMAKLGGKAAADATKTNALQSLKNTLKAGGTAGAGEAVTEGYQTFAEGEVKGKPASAGEIYEGAVIGAVAGAGLSGGARGVAEVMKATPEHAKERVQEEAKVATFDKAVAEKTPEAFLDEASPDYNPAKAVAVIHEVAKQEPEKAADRLKEATSIIDSLEKQKTDLESVEAQTSPERVEVLKGNIDMLNQEIEVTDKDDPDMAELQADLTKYTEQLDMLTNPERSLARKNKLTALNRQLEEARESHTALYRMTNPLPSVEEVSAAVEQANSTDKEVSSKAGQVLLKLAMAAPDDLDPTVIKNLVENKSNGLTTEQRNLLRKFSAARIAELEVKKQREVSQEILFGQKKKDGNIGIAQYRERIAAAIEGDSEVLARRDLAMLEKFGKGHAEKLRVVMGAKAGDQVVNQDGKWVVNKGERLNDKQRRENGAVNITPATPTLIREIQNEVKALRGAYAQLSGAVALKFGGAAVQSVPSPAATSVPQNKSMKKSVEGETRPSVPDEPAVVGEPQKEVKGKVNTAPAASPQSQPASPVAATAAPATAAQSAPAAEKKAAEKAVSSNENGPAKSQPEATQQQDGTPVPTPAADVATAEETNINQDKGILSVLASKIEDATGKLQAIYQNPKFNPIAQFFNQKRTNETQKTTRPLVVEKDFLSAWLDGKFDVAKFLGFHPEVSEDGEIDQNKPLRHFVTNARKWNEQIKNQIGEGDKDPEYFDRDMMQHFVRADGKPVELDENVLTAMSFGMYHSLVAEANAPAKTDEQMNRMHGRDKDADFDRANVYNMLHGVWNVEDMVAAELGAMAVQALGLTATKNAPQDIMPRLQAALGKHMLIALEASEMIERRPINTAQINSYFEANDTVIGDEKFTMYVFPNRDALKAFKDINKGTKGIIDKLFGADPASTFATEKPVPFKQAVAQHTQQRIPKVLKKALDTLHKTPHTVIPDMWEVMGGLGFDNVLEVMGWRDPETVHINNRKGVEAKNQGLIRQAELALEMLGAKDFGDAKADITTPRYVQAQVWKNFRVGILTDSLNQQTSKLHRFMFARPSWTVKVDLTDTAQMARLELALAAGLGMKTDDQPNAQTLDLFNDELLKPKVRAALEAMKAGMFRNDWSGKDAITAFAKKDGMMALQALTMLAKYQNAVLHGARDVEITLLAGADGKTNGPMLTHLALGAATDAKELMETMVRGGFYSVGDEQPKHFSQWRKDSQGKDLYQDLASVLMKNIQRTPLLIALESILGKLEDGGDVTKEGRNLVKTPLTAFAFGSSLPGSIRSMENKFIESIYAKIEELAALEEADKPADVAGFLKALNTLVQSQNPALGDMSGVTAKELLNATLNEDVEKALRDAFNAVMKKPVKDTMETYFYNFIQRRSDLNSTIQAGHAMYAAAYKVVRAQVIQGLLEDGTIASRVGRKDSAKGKLFPRHDLTEAQEKVIRDKVTAILPVAHTAYTVGGDLAEGIYMGKQDRSLSGAGLLGSTINFKKRVLTAEGTMRYKLKAKSMVRTEISPGVAGTPYFIHSLDSALMHTALIDVAESLNVHDEIGNSFDQIHRAAGAINRATIQKMIEFSPAREALNMLERIAINMAESVKDGSVTKEAVAEMMAEWKAIIERRYQMDRKNKVSDVELAGLIVDGPKELTPGAVVKMMMDMALDNAVKADTVRLETIAQLGTVDQYTWEDGQYEVTKEDRKRARELLKNMETDIDPKAKLAMSQLVAFVNGVELPTALKRVEQSDEVPSTGVTGADKAAVARAVGNNPQAIARAMDKLQGSGFTPWGEIGPSTRDVNRIVQREFLDKPVKTKADIINLLERTLKGSNLMMFNQVKNLLPNNLSVEMVTPRTEDTITLPDGEVSALYVSTTDGQHVVYVKSAEFRNHAMNPDVLLHEMIHGILAAEIANPSSPESQALVDDLTAMMKKIDSFPGSYKFAHALKDVQEFVAWGMTDPEFQKYLMQVEYRGTKTVGNKLINAWKSFVNNLTSLIFGKSNEIKERALVVLLHDVAGLFEQVSQNGESRVANVLAHSAPAQTYTTEQIYTELGQNNPLAPEDDARLRGLMSSIVDVMAPVYGVLGKDAMTSTLSAKSVWANAMAGGQAPFALDAVSVGFAGNEQVAFMLEQTEAILRAAFNGADGRTSVAYTETVKLYEEARKALEGKLDPKLYDFLFNIENKDDGSSDYLSRFASMALVHPDVNKALAFDTDKGTKKEKAATFLGRLQDAFEKVLEWVVGRWTRTYAGQQADQKLDALAVQLVKIEATRRARLNVERSKTLESIEDAFRDAAEKARDKVDDIASSDFFKESKNGFVRFAGSMTSTVAKDRLDFFMQAFEDFRNQHFNYSQGMLAGLVTELRGSNNGNKMHYKLLRSAKFMEGRRKDMITGTAKVALESFVNKGKDLKDEHKTALSNVGLRTDMVSLMNRFDMKGLRELVADPAALAKAIVQVTEELGKPRHQMFYINAAKALGYQMVTGEARTANNLQNARNIARLYGTKHTSEVQQNTIDKMEPLIDVMASLYAIQYTQPGDKAAFVKVLDAELARGKEGNGVEMMLRMHEQLQKQSKERLFKDQESLMVKGYTPEIYNPFIEVQVVSPDDVETLKEQGFGQPMSLPLADADPERQAKVLMARHGTGLQAHTTGTMSLTSMSTKGTTKHNGVLDLFSDQGQYNQGMMLKIARDAADDIEAMFRQPMEPAAEKRTFLVPVLNPQGKVVNYRYMMNNRTKQEVLQRDSRFDKLLGTMAGSIFDKQTTPEQNAIVVKALHEQYKLEGSKRPKSFVYVGPNSPDPELREIYRLMPDSTKNFIREEWKTEGMMVRIDLLDMTFGYRKLSMSDVLKKDRELRTGMDKFFGEVLGFVFSGGKILGQGADPKDVAARDAIATMRIRQFEEGWQSVVREIKDTLVVKSVSTFIGNMQSNFTLLYAYGVPLTDVLRHHRIAFRGAVAYKRDSDELFALQTKLDTGMSGSINEDKKRVAQLKDALAKNPVRELIEAGLMPTIVEDVELDDDIYSFKSRMMTKLEDRTKWINKDVKNAAKQLYMAHDTKVYKALSQAAQLSDFLGRYTLYQHMTTRKRDPMSKEDAIQLASDAFINYDVPTHRKMQYMNEMGFFRFTKYYLRIQKVIMHLYRDNPGRMMGLMGLEWYFSSVASVLDSSMMTRFGNPLEAGALDAHKAVTELGTVKALAIPFK